ncbi:uncharacterized protein LOC132195779 [Neocloeon triangulifer]|uniref:uncharacterized protein LOC132195779 n=1 Tax=Neocloeon triangulifer TaxID=2078957 RepID=UPI00286F9B97|nr:uncharacterized protein LOC132195779 [Neocloeon triangulifer]
MLRANTLLLCLLLSAASAAAASDLEADDGLTTLAPSQDGPEARIELDDDDDYEEGEYLAPKTVLECVMLADWPCVQVKTFRAIREWLNIGTSVVQSKPISQDEENELQSKTEEEENHEDQEEPDTDDEYDLKEATALLSGLGKEPSSSWAGSLEVLAEMLYDGVSAFLGAESEDEQRALLKKGIEKLENAGRKLEQARKKFGLGGHGHHGVGNLLGLITFKMSKIMTVLSAFSALVQLKSLGVTMLGLLLAASSLFIQFKTNVRPLHPIVKVLHLHPRPHVTVNAGPDFPEASHDWDGGHEHDHEYGAYEGYNEQAYEHQAKQALLAKYKLGRR